MCSVWISEQAAIISLYSIKRLVFITEMERVYCAIWTEFVVIIKVNITVRGVKSPKVEFRQNICFSLTKTQLSNFLLKSSGRLMNVFQLTAQKVRLACSRASYKLFPSPI